MSDILLKYDEAKKIYDINFTAEGDLETSDSFDTAILMSIYCFVRATAGEVEPSQRRRGDWSNTLNENSEYEVGSKLWLKEQSKLNDDCLNDLEDLARQGLQWLIDDGYLKDIEINAVADASNRGAILSVKLIRFDDSFETKLYNMWELTGQGA